MNRKNAFGRVLLIVSLIATLCLSIDIIYGYLTKERSWNEQMRTSLVGVLEDSMEKRGKEDVYIDCLTLTASAEQEILKMIARR